MCSSLYKKVDFIEYMCIPVLIMLLKPTQLITDIDGSLKLNTSLLLTISMTRFTNKLTTLRSKKDS